MRPAKHSGVTGINFVLVSEPWLMSFSCSNCYVKSSRGRESGIILCIYSSILIIRIGDFPQNVQEGILDK